MRICITAETGEGLAAPRCSHFGRTPYFAFVDVAADNSLEFVEAVPNDAHEKGHGAIVDLIKQHGAQAIVVANIGAPMLENLKSAGLVTYQNREEATVEGAARAFAECRVLPAQGHAGCSH